MRQGVPVAEQVFLDLSAEEQSDILQIMHVKHQPLFQRQFYFLLILDNMQRDSLLFLKLQP